MRLISIYLLTAILIGAATWPASAMKIESESLEGWNLETGDGKVIFTPDGESISMYLEDDPATAKSWGRWSKKMPGAYAIHAVVRVDDYKGDDVALGIRKYVGLTDSKNGNGGNPILATLHLYIYEHKFRIYYKVREMDENYQTVNVLAKGMLGNFDNMWQLGEKVIIAFAHIGQDIYFYTSKVQAFTKVMLLNNVVPLTPEWSDVTVDGWVWETDGHISGEISNVKVFQ